MKFFRSLAAPALLVSFLTANVPVVMADEKAKIVESAKGLASRILLAESDKLQVLEIRQKPGEVITPSTTVSAQMRSVGRSWSMLFGQQSTCQLAKSRYINLSSLLPTQK